MPKGTRCSRITSIYFYFSSWNETSFMLNSDLGEVDHKGPIKAFLRRDHFTGSRVFHPDLRVNELTSVSFVWIWRLILDRSTRDLISPVSPPLLFVRHENPSSSGHRWVYKGVDKKWVKRAEKQCWTCACDYMDGCSSSVFLTCRVSCVSCLNTWNDPSVTLWWVWTHHYVTIEPCPSLAWSTDHLNHQWTEWATAHNFSDTWWQMHCFNPPYRIIDVQTFICLNVLPVEGWRWPLPLIFIFCFIR